MLAGGGSFGAVQAGMPCELVAYGVGRDPEAGSSVGAIASALHATMLLIAHQLVMDLERYRERAEVVTVSPLCPLSVPPQDFSRAGELIERVAEQTRRWLDRGRLTRQCVPDALRSHTA